MAVCGKHQLHYTCSFTVSEASTGYTMPVGDKLQFHCVHGKHRFYYACWWQAPVSLCHDIKR